MRLALSLALLVTLFLERNPAWTQDRFGWIETVRWKLDLEATSKTVTTRESREIFEAWVPLGTTIELEQRKDHLVKHTLERNGAAFAVAFLPIEEPNPGATQLKIKGGATLEIDLDGLARLTPPKSTMVFVFRKQAPQKLKPFTIADWREILANGTAETVVTALKTYDWISVKPDVASQVDESIEWLEKNARRFGDKEIADELLKQVKFLKLIQRQIEVYQKARTPEMTSPPRGPKG